MTEIEKAIKIITEFQSKHGKPITEYEVTQEQLDKLRSEASYMRTSPADPQLENTIMGVRIKVVPSEIEQLRQQLAKQAERIKQQSEVIVGQGSRISDLERILIDAAKNEAEFAERELKLTTDLAASQAREKVLRSVLEFYMHNGICEPLYYKARDALNQPTDDSSLKSLVKQAGEVMRERCRSVAFDMSYADSLAVDVSQAIKAIPAITMVDLK